MRHAWDNLLTNLKANLAHIFAADPWSMVSIDWNVLCFENWGKWTGQVSGRSHALSPCPITLSPCHHKHLGLVFNVTPSVKILMSLTPVFHRWRHRGVFSMQSRYSTKIMRYGICMGERGVHFKCVCRNPRTLNCIDYWKLWWKRRLI